MFITDDLMQRWWALEAKLLERFGKKPDLEAVLFLIGLQETGFMAEKISKGKSPLTNDEVVRGLREALKIGTNKSTAATS
ncbi:MAG: hypothetical protein B7Z27_00590, partial [Sphingobacteriia bacterium 32-37-4]